MTTSASARERYERFREFVEQDPSNSLLLAEAADAATAARAFDDADQYIANGIVREGNTPPWRFRLATLRLAQGRLLDARDLLQGLRADGILHPSIDHNLAYAALLEGDYAACVEILDPWVHGKASALDAAEIATLWLRAMHHLGRLADAWKWIESNGLSALDATGAGVAALVALDHDRGSAAETLSASALRRDPRQPEALIVRGSLLIGRRDMEGARREFAAVTEHHPHQPRGWTMLGFASLLAGQGADARAHFNHSLSLLPGDTGTRVALGWANLLTGDLDSAVAAFRDVTGLEPDSADAHGGMAVALALQGHGVEAANHAQLARQIKPGHVAARYADALVTGDAERLGGLQKIVELLFGPEDEVTAKAS